MIEILESRIAPAAVFQFTDVDGDRVTISSSKGTDTQLANAVTLSNGAAAAIGKPHTLTELTLGPNFANAAISITAKPSTDLTGTKQLMGQGIVNVGEINAPSIDLASVTVHGDLGQIVVGSGSGSQVGLGSLKVLSMGDYGLSTGAASVDSRFEGGVNSISIAGDANGVLLRAFVNANETKAGIGSVYIGGSLIGGATSDTGEVLGATGIGKIVIGGSIEGGAGSQTGRIASDMGSLGTVIVHGDVIGGSGSSSGEFFSPNNFTSLTVGGSIIGGSAQGAGLVTLVGDIGKISITGTVEGGSAQSTGGISGGSIGSVSIGGSLTGTAFSSTTSVDHTAFIRSAGNIGSVTVGGSITPGSETGGGTLSFSGAIQAGQTLGSVIVSGDLNGNATNPVIISGVGLAKPTKQTQDPAIRSVTVGGTAYNAMIMGGYDTSGNAAAGDAQIGTVTIKGDLIASDIVSGVKTTIAYFGSGTDSVIDQPSGATSDGIYATIARVVIGGQIEGLENNLSATFAIEAQEIGFLSEGGTALPLKPGPGNDGFFVAAQTGHDVHVKELGGS